MHKVKKGTHPTVIRWICKGMQTNSNTTYQQEMLSNSIH